MRSLLHHMSTQHGVASVAEIYAHGVTRHQLAWMVRGGELVRLHHGVYRHAAAPPTRESRLRGALLAAGPDAVVSHRSAVARHGVRGFDCELVELTHPGSTRLVRPGLVIHRSRTLAQQRPATVGGMRVTSAARTLVDVAAVLPPTLVGRWAQEWLSDRKVTIDDLERSIAMAGNHVGARRMRQQLGHVVVGADSRDEALLGKILRSAGLPPELHTVVTTAAGPTYELDWAYPASRLGLELDGYGVHLRSLDVFERDRFRRNELTLDGWTILTFTSRQCRRRPDVVVSQVARALRVGSC